MKRMKHWTLYVLLFLGLNSTVFAQSEIASSTPENYKGIAIDVFPIISRLFSGDNTQSTFSFRYVRANSGKIFELGLAPEFRKNVADNSQPQLTRYGADVYSFLGKQKNISNRLFVIWGFGLNYGYSHSKSLNEQIISSQFEFEFTSDSHSVGVGPELKFGYQLLPRLQIRSEIGAKASMAFTKTNISNGSLSSFDQKLESYDVSLFAPEIIEIVYLF